MPGQSQGWGIPIGINIFCKNTTAKNWDEY